MGMLRLFVVLALASFTAGVSAAPDLLATVAEQSGFKRTGRYAEVEQLCRAYAKQWPKAVRCFEFGRTPEGRPMLALAASRTGALTPEQARKRGVPVTVMQGGIHSGEIDGKDAGFLALREMLQGKAAPQALDSFVFVFVPVFNIDGHERFGRWNRPNQAGPEEMGWRVTSQNYNLNRDYTKADAPEMQAMLRLLVEWDPVLYVDLHVTDGAEFEHDIANLVEPIYCCDNGLQPAGRTLLGELNKKLAEQGSLPVDFYPSFIESDNPASGFKVGAYPPRFSTGYWALHNRFALLVETHSWKDYPTRVRITRNTIVILSEMTARQGKKWRAQQQAADQRAAKLGGSSVALSFENGPSVKTIEFRGYAYTREPSEISGALMTRYDNRTPQLWRIPLKDTVVPKLSVVAPAGGYVVTAAHAAWMSGRLKMHGVQFVRLTKPKDAVNVEAFRATKVTLSQRSFEGRTTAQFEGQWGKEQRGLPAGSLFVPIAQSRARVAMALLEPQAPDSFAAWGFFNADFETKEYMEPYVAEQVAREMLAKDPKIAAEFRKRLAEDAEFAKNPAARLDFFYRKHASWDERSNLYPVYRLAAEP